MDYDDNLQKSKQTGDLDPVVQETHEIFRLYEQKREDWAVQAQEDREYRLGKQWSQEQVNTLKSRGQAPIVVNRIHPAVETAKAMLTSNRPSFRVAPREDSDNKVANVLNGMLSYMYDISDGRTVIRQAIDDYYVTGVGYILVYQDPLADDGKGEVKIKDIDPVDVYVDPNARDRYFDDAENIIISRTFTKDQAKTLYPMYKNAIEASTSDYKTDEIATGNVDDTHVTFPGTIDTLEEDEYIRGYERYYKTRVTVYRIHEKFSKKEFRLEQEEFERYIEQIAGRLNGKILTNPQDMQRANETQSLQRQQAMQNAQQKIDEQIERQKEELEVQFIEKEQQLIELVEIGEMVPERMELDLANFREQIETATKQAYEQAMQEAGLALNIPDVEEVTYAQLIKEGLIDAVPVSIEQVKQCVIMGDQKLYTRILPTSTYPIVPMVNLFTRTPFPMSDVRMVKGMQDYINKTRSLIIAHAITSTNMKVLIPAGSVDMKEFEEKWAQPGVGIEVDFDMGQPVVAQPVPLPNELYQNEQTAKSDIDHQLGLYEMMMGNSQAAPQTYKATISLDEFGQRKIKSKLSDVEACLTRVGQTAVQLMQELHQTEKVFRVVNPNNSITEYAINKKLFDDKTGEIQIFNDITVGKYDVVYVSGSTLPSNRYAELEFYMEALKAGLVDRQEVLKKTEIFDMEGVLQRTDTIAQLQQQLEAATKQLKKLSGDMQTLTRENVHLKQKVEVEKFKSGLDKVENKASAAGSLFEKRLDDQLSLVEKQVRDASKEKTSPPSASKGAGKSKGKK